MAHNRLQERKTCTNRQAAKYSSKTERHKYVDCRILQYKKFIAKYKSDTNEDTQINPFKSYLHLSKKGTGNTGQS
jgi:hypothetical protein